MNKTGGAALKPALGVSVFASSNEVAKSDMGFKRGSEIALFGARIGERRIAFAAPRSVKERRRVGRPRRVRHHGAARGALHSAVLIRDVWVIDVKRVGREVAVNFTVSKFGRDRGQLPNRGIADEVVSD